MMISKAILTFLVFTHSLFSFSQTVNTPIKKTESKLKVTTANGENILYKGCTNPVQISIPDFPKMKFAVRTSKNIKILFNKKNWEIKVDSGKTGKLFVSEIKNGGKSRFIDSCVFKIKGIPDPVPALMYGIWEDSVLYAARLLKGDTSARKISTSMLKHQSGDTLSLKVIKNVVGLIPQFYMVDCGAAEMYSCQLYASKKGKTMVFSMDPASMKSGMFSNEIKKFMKVLESQTKIFIESKAKLSDGSVHSLPTISFKII